jgi:chromosome segregation ATPase
MSPLSRMRDSRDQWKMKNRGKRKRINKLARKVTASEENMGRKEEEIRELKFLLETSKDSTPQSADIDKELQRLEEENRRQKEEIRRLEDENDKKQPCVPIRLWTRDAGI